MRVDPLKFALCSRHRKLPLLPPGGYHCGRHDDHDPEAEVPKALPERGDEQLRNVRRAGRPAHEPCGPGREESDRLRQTQRIKTQEGGADDGTDNDQDKTTADRFLTHPCNRRLGVCDRDCLDALPVLGHLIDEMLNTPPTFMLGLFFLALVLCIGGL